MTEAQNLYFNDRVICCPININEKQLYAATTTLTLMSSIIVAA